MPGGDLDINDSLPRKGRDRREGVRYDVSSSPFGIIHLFSLSRGQAGKYIIH